MLYTYTVHELPSDPSSAVTVLDRFALLRLAALQNSPARLASDYTYESAYTESDWMAILTDPMKHHLICVAHGPDAVDRTLNSGTWVGMLCLRGPLSKTQFDFAGRVGPELGPDERETRWRGMGLYLERAHRASAAHMKIHEALLAFVRAFTDENLPVTVRTNGMENEKHARICGTVMRSEGSQMLKTMYETWGMYEVGRITTRENFAFAGVEVLESMSGKDLGDERDVTAYEMLVSC